MASGRDIRSAKFIDGTEVKYHQCSKQCGGSNSCGVVMVDLSDGEWFPTSCRDNRYVICERPLSMEGIVEHLVKKWNLTLHAVDKLIKDKDTNITHLISENAKLEKNITHVMSENAKLREKVTGREQSSKRREEYLISKLKNFIDDLGKIRDGN